MRKGNDNSAAKLVESSMAPQPFDMMGFQECGDIGRVLGYDRMRNDYEAFQGPNGVCMAYRKAGWSLLSQGDTEVAEDSRLQYYGRRSAQWMRLKHTGSGKIIFFMNHHGPLPVDSGGMCGGRSTAINLMMLVQQQGHPGDSVIMVGDFNAGENSETLKTLETKLTRAYSTGYLGGIDNVFTNVHNPGIFQDLGSGGSDHHALSAVIEVRPPCSVTPPPGGGSWLPKAIPLGPFPKDRGQCQCKCEWAKSKDACDHDDGSCCWLQCCTPVYMNTAVAAQV